MLRPPTQAPAGTSLPVLSNIQAWKLPFLLPLLTTCKSQHYPLLTSQVPRLIIRTLQVTGTLALTLGLGPRPGVMVSAGTGTWTNLLLNEMWFIFPEES